MHGRVGGWGRKQVRGVGLGGVGWRVSGGWADERGQLDAQTGRHSESAQSAGAGLPALPSPHASKTGPQRAPWRVRPRPSPPHSPATQDSPTCIAGVVQAGARSRTDKWLLAAEAGRLRPAMPRVGAALCCGCQKKARASQPRMRRAGQAGRAAGPWQVGNRRRAGPAAAAVVEDGVLGGGRRRWCRA